MDGPRSEASLAELLQRAETGDADASKELLPYVYDSLKRAARRQMRVCGRETLLDTTALVHEAWIGLFANDRTSSRWQDHAHFLRYSGRTVRNVLIDHLRASSSEKRGGGLLRVEFSGDEPALDLDQEALLELDQALLRLSEISPRLVEVVELRFFAGLEVEEVARVLEVSARTVVREWRKALMLLKEIMGDQR
jgi:RNA polymerase sigma factor (TIGR02999 family)